MTTLVACAHGTNSLEGRAAIRSVIDGVRLLVPEATVVEAFVDVQDPRVDDVVDRATASGPVVVVPVLLSTGFHTRVDIARAVGRHPGRAIAAPSLGPHDLLALVLESRLAELDVDGGDAIILAAAGSSDPAAEVDVRQMARRLSQCVHIPVSVGFAAGSSPRIAEAVESARSAGAERVIAASYVLAPGFFAEVISRCGADAVTAPLAPDIRIAALVAERFRAAEAELAAGIAAH